MYRRGEECMFIPLRCVREGCVLARLSPYWDVYPSERTGKIACRLRMAFDREPWWRKLVARITPPRG